MEFRTNRLENPSFETGDFTGWPTANNAFEVIRHPDAAHGDHVVRLNDSTGWRSLQARGDYAVPVNEGEVWRLSGRIRNIDASAGSFQVMFNGTGMSGDWETRNTQVNDVPTDSWTLIETTLTVPAGVTNIWAKFQAHQNLTGSLLLDDTSLENMSLRPPPPPDTSPNPDPVAQPVTNYGGWSYDLVRTRDGARVASLEPINHPSWGRKIDEGTGGNVSFKVTGDNASLAWAANRPDRRTLVVSWNGAAVYAGILRDPEYDVKNKIIEASHSDIWSLMDDRLASPRYMAWDDPDRTIRSTRIRYANRSRRTLVKRAVQLGMTGIDPNAPAYDLPFVFPADETGNWSRWLRTADWMSVTDWIKQLAERGGPMFTDFTPEWSNGRLRWRLRVFHNLLTYPTEVLHVDVPQSPVTALRLKHSVADYASEYHVVGSGEGADVLHNYWSSSYLASDQVARVKVFTDGSIEDFDELTEWRDGLIERHTNATVQLDATVSIGEGDDTINPANLVLGQRILVRTSDDPILPAGDVETMLIGFSPNGPNSLKLELSPVDGFTGHSVEPASLHYRNLNSSAMNSAVYERIRRNERRVIGSGMSTLNARSED